MRVSFYLPRRIMQPKAEISHLPRGGNNRPPFVSILEAHIVTKMFETGSKLNGARRGVSSLSHWHRRFAWSLSLFFKKKKTAKSPKTVDVFALVISNLLQSFSALKSPKSGLDISWTK
ncbi:hypothetical protein M413DRAFT_349338 [Hebeloma cylindrosporum]|uniref:Uncharacterized protein n=1 Tax=Hebeloma cylindrosporum TaxID=76867 RepID=A0A0C3BF47_HEBCY|nr:hypothetical protein M413DRAFT_349338 [Hebeloma cylindrosporum h7]